MIPSYFPLRWESTGDQWWYAAPVDWAAANGHYDLVRELIRLDNNLLIKLSSLRRIRRLETVWDDTPEFIDAAKGRSNVARNLLLECETKGGNSLIRAGYGGWLLYTAAAAGDVGFVQELLNRDPLLVFGEGEYGVTDILYAAARSKNSEIFRFLFNSSISSKCSLSSSGESIERSVNISTVFKWEMINRAVHAAARGGNIEILKELLVDYPDVLAYRDIQGSTILHAAAGKGQSEVVKDLVVSFNIVTSRDNQGNTALHVAAYRGHFVVLKPLVLASPSSVSLTNNAGDTFLHMAVAGFRSPSFRQLDRQIELMKSLVCGELVNLTEIINCRNGDGRTVLHMAVIGNIDSSLVELLMTVPSINLNIRDIDGRTPLDLLSQHPRSASSEILMKHLISAGGISNSRDFETRSAIVSQLKTQGISSPGTSFKIPDAEIFLYAGVENASETGDRGSARPSYCSTSSKSEFSQFERHGSSEIKKSSSVNYAAKQLKILLGWSRRKVRERNQNGNLENPLKMLGEDSPESYKRLSNLEETPTPLRLRFSKPSLLNNKRTLAVRSALPSPSVKKKYSAGLMQGVIQGMPHLVLPFQSPSRSSLLSPSSSDKLKSVMLDNEIVGDPSGSNTSLNIGAQEMDQKSSSTSNRLMNQYFCFGHGLSAENPINVHRSNRAYKPSVLSVA